MISVDSLIPDATGPGFVSVDATRFRALIGDNALVDWTGFAESWNHLELDRHMADGGRSRRRRYASFLAAQGRVTREPHGPHFQSRDYNRLNGGVDRWFAPIAEEVAGHPVVLRLLELCLATFTKARGSSREALPWRVEMHQFRIEPGAGAPGTPTPEGMHRDGVDWVFVTLIDRTNVAGGVTSIADAASKPLGAFTLREPLDAVFLDDSRVRHGVTPIEGQVPGLAAHRDVLVLTFRSLPEVA